VSERSEASRSESETVSPESSTRAVNNRRQTGNDNLVSRQTLSREDLEEIAEKVYRMMRHDLMLERERASKIGG
jgi:hypothetical protein